MGAKSAFSLLGLALGLMIFTLIVPIPGFVVRPVQLTGALRFRQAAYDVYEATFTLIVPLQAKDKGWWVYGDSECLQGLKNARCCDSVSCAYFSNEEDDLGTLTHLHTNTHSLIFTGHSFPSTLS